MKSQDRSFSVLWQFAVVLFGFFGLYTLAALAIVGINWVYGDWEWSFNVPALLVFWGGLGMGGLFLVVLALMGLWRISKWGPFTRSKARNRFREQAMATFNALLVTPDDALLPMLPYQPAAPADITRPRRRIAPLPNLKLDPDGVEIWRIFGSFGFIFATLPTLFESLIFDIAKGNAQTAHDFRDALNAFNLVFALIIPYIFGYGIFISAQIFKGWRVFADEQGLRWRRFGRWVVLPWAEIRTIGISEDDSPNNITAARYVIASETKLITWNLPLMQPMTPWLNPVRDSAATERMLAIVMANTGLPLRDLRPLTLAIAQHTNTSAPPTAFMLGAARPPQIDPALATAVATHIAATPPPPQRTRWVAIVFIAVVFLVISPWPMLLSNETRSIYFPHYLAALPARVQARPVLLHDTLRGSGQGWPHHAPAAQDGDAIGFIAGGYNIVNGGGQGIAVLPDTYHAVAIQVTVRMSGTTQATDVYKDGVGVIVRQHAVATTDHYGDCRLLITMQGQWGDTCGYDAHSPNGYSAYIHQGPGAVNTLMVVARAQLYSFYLNGHFVGYNYEENTEPFGQIGLINQAQGVSATFTDFTVWALNPPPSPFFV